MTRERVMFIALMVAITAGCIDKGVKGKPLPLNTLDSVRISYDMYWDIPFGGLNAIAYTLYIYNFSSSELDECKVTLNGEYSAQLLQMICYRGPLNWSGDYGSNTIPPGATLEFDFSHDTENNRVFRNAKGRPLPSAAVIKQVKIECSRGVGEWRFEPSFLLWRFE